MRWVTHSFILATNRGFPFIHSHIRSHNTFLISNMSIITKDTSNLAITALSRATTDVNSLTNRVATQTLMSDLRNQINKVWDLDNDTELAEISKRTLRISDFLAGTADGRPPKDHRLNLNRGRLESLASLLTDFNLEQAQKAEISEAIDRLTFGDGFDQDLLTRYQSDPQYRHLFVERV
jgi:hypothetical protein